MSVKDYSDGIADGTAKRKAGANRAPSQTEEYVSRRGIKFQTQATVVEAPATKRGKGQEAWQEEQTSPKTE